MNNRINLAWEAMYQEVKSIDVVTLLGQLTLFMLVFYGPGGWFITSIYKAALVLSLAFPRIVKHPALWLILIVSSAFAVYTGWQGVLNSTWLMFYWMITFMLATFVCRGSLDDLRSFLRHNANFMIVAIMGLAVVQKIFGAGYLSGASFELALLTQPNLYLLSHYIGGLSFQDLFTNVDLLKSLPYQEVILVTSSRITFVALVITYFVLVIEAAIAILFLLKRTVYVYAAHMLLGVFIIGVYFVVPAYPFIILFAILGIASLPDRSPRLFCMYVFLVLLTFIYEMPWFTIYNLAIGNGA